MKLYKLNKKERKEYINSIKYQVYVYIIFAIFLFISVLYMCYILVGLNFTIFGLLLGIIVLLIVEESLAVLSPIILIVGITQLNILIIFVGLILWIIGIPSNMEKVLKYIEG